MPTTTIEPRFPVAQLTAVTTLTELPQKGMEEEKMDEDEHVRH
jgi:hypothetical protein